MKKNLKIMDAAINKDFIVGPSVGFETYWDIDQDKQLPHYSKIQAEEYRTEIGGSSYNITMALVKQGCNADLLQFIGKGTDDLYGNLLRSISVPGVRTTTIPCLCHTHTSSIHRTRKGEHQEEHVLEFKGSMNTNAFYEHREVIKSTYDGYEWKIASGIRDSNEEMLFLVDNFCGGSTNVLIPKIDLIKSDHWKNVIPLMDIIFMNSAEFNSIPMKIKDYHELGLPLLVITNGEKGGKFSFNGKVKEYEAINLGFSEIYETGAGDWLAGSCCASLKKQGIKRIRETGIDKITEAILYASKVTGVKVGMPGASNGPSGI